MPAVFSDSPGKQAVRELWNTPILRHLNTAHGLRYRYMGLPGVRLIDITLWKDMIDEIVAFEVRAQPNRRDPDGRRNILELRENLRKINIPSVAYYGSMEQVVCLRRDFDGVEYSQSNLVTLYNLDFCDEIASKIETPEHGKQIWRFAAIRQILQDQSECFVRTQEDSLFVIMLTCRNQIGGRQLLEFLNDQLYADTESYINMAGGRSAIPGIGPLIGSHGWALKGYLYDQFRQYMSNPHVSSIFLPVVKYIGTPVRTMDGPLESPMFHWMAVCKFGDRQARKATHLPPSYLSSISSVLAQGSDLTWDPEPGEDVPANGTPDPVRYVTPWLRQLLATETAR